jgi:predicted AlkP superfamily phosphohydrolase/phosphomutase
MQRRTFIKGLSALPFVPNSLPMNLLLKGSRAVDKVLVLGMDGMEISLLKRFVAEGHMPTFKRFIAGAGYSGPLKTTLPALSPVAWSSFITGCNPGRHGIFDFVARDPKTITPFLSTSKTEAAKEIDIAGFKFPWGGGISSARESKALWSYLAENGVAHSFFRLPGNYPCEVGQNGTAISGMGTPDLTGAYGTATLLLEADSSPLTAKSGSRVLLQRPKNFEFSLTLKGPPNPFSKKHEISEVELKVLKDPVKTAVKIEVDGKNFILEQGKWSEWIPVKFSFMAGISGAEGMFQCYLRSVHPALELYISPILIDPLANAIPTSQPPSYAEELAKNIGRYNTLGLPADTKSLSNGLLSDEEYLQQAVSVLDENLKAFDFELNRFSEGLLFFYFSSLDQNQHMLWRCFDEKHPLHDPKASPQMKNAIRDLYIEMDQILKQALSKVDSRTLVLVMSDHGFMPFTREFELNTWLKNEGYLALHPEAQSKPVEELSLFSDVDWKNTSAYALGFSGLYLNVAGREPNGTVDPKDSQRYLKEISSKLSSTVDSATGSTVGRAVPAIEEYSGDAMELSPDILMAYAPGVRVSDNSILGGFADSTFNPRTNKWSADHCMEPARVPGVLLSSHALNVSDPAIWDLAPMILSALGLSFGDGAFDGRKIFK